MQIQRPRNECCHTTVTYSYTHIAYTTLKVHFYTENKTG